VVETLTPSEREFIAAVSDRERLREQVADHWRRDLARKRLDNAWAALEPGTVEQVRDLWAMALTLSAPPLPRRRQRAS
jgi:hypothetical protein